MKIKANLSFVFRVIIALIFIQTLYFKFTAHPDSVYIFSKLGLEPFGRIGLGVIELITAVLLVKNKTKLLGILDAFSIISGALFSHFLVLGFNVKNDNGSLFSLAIIIFVLSIALLIMHKKDFKNSIKTIK